MADNEEKKVNQNIEDEWDNISHDDLIQAINEAEAEAEVEEKERKKSRQKKEPLTNEQKKALAEEKSDIITDLFRIPQLNDNIRLQIRNLCRNEFIEPKHIDDLPHYCFHINFKKNLLEECVRQAIRDGELTPEDLLELYELMGIEKKGAGKEKPLYTIEDFKLELFKLKKVTDYTTFDLELFNEYTQCLEGILGQIEKYQTLIYVLMIVSLKYRISSKYLSSPEINPTIQTIEDSIEDESFNGLFPYSIRTLLKDAKIVNEDSCEDDNREAILKRRLTAQKKLYAFTHATLMEAGVYDWNDMVWSETEKQEGDNNFNIYDSLFTLNYTMESKYYLFRHLIDDEDEKIITSKIDYFNIYKHETAAEKYFKQYYRPNSDKYMVTAAEYELSTIYDRYYEVLLSDVFDFSPTFISNVLTPTFEMLLKLQFNSELQNAILKASTTMNIDFTQDFLARFLNKNVGNFGKILSMVETRLPDISVVSQLSNFLNTTPGTLLGYTDSLFNPYLTTESIQAKYGIEKETLEHLEQLNESMCSMDPEVSKYFNRGLNRLIRNSAYAGGTINYTNKLFIQITKEELQEIKNLYIEGLTIARNSSIPHSIFRGNKKKVKDNIEVLYHNDINPRIRQIVKGTTIIDILENRKKYRINNKVITVTPILDDAYYTPSKEKKPPQRVIIQSDNIRNGTRMEGGKEIWELDLYDNRGVTVGDEDKDFFTPLMQYTGGVGHSIRVIGEDDLEFLYKATQEKDDESSYLAIDGFYEEVSTNYGLLKGESDDLLLLEIISKLKNYKDSLKKQ